MPEKGIELTPKENILTDNEISRLVHVFSQAGVNKIRLTGGEPTIKKNLIDICKDIKSNENIKNSCYDIKWYW